MTASDDDLRASVLSLGRANVELPGARAARSVMVATADAMRTGGDHRPGEGPCSWCDEGRAPGATKCACGRSGTGREEGT